MKKTLRGFTLLEALVALALLASTGIALLAWIQQNMDYTRRVQEDKARSAIQIEVSQYIETLNPMLTPQGKVQLGSMRLEWQSKELVAKTSLVHGSDQPGDFMLALYAVDVQAAHDSVTEPVRFSQKVLGWRRVRARAAMD